jgi:lipopolysaccharide/colanic/teichoic acid biosynthesis glycosyltransferase
MLAQSVGSLRSGVRERIALGLARIPGGVRRYVVLAHDVLAGYGSFLLAVYLRQGSLDMQPGMQTAHALAPIFLLLFTLTAYHYRMHQGVWRFATQSDLLTIAKVAGISIGLFYLGLFLVHRLEDVPRSLPLIQWLVFVFLLAGTRIAYAARLNPQRVIRSDASLAGWEPVLLVGAGQTAAILIDLLRPPSELAIVGIIDDRAHYRNRAISGVPVLGGLGEVERVVAQLAVHGMRPRRIVLARGPDEIGPEGLQALYAAAERLDVLVQDAIEFLRSEGAGDQSTVSSESLTAMQLTVCRGWRWAAKRLIDVLMAAPLLLLASPAMLVIAAAVRVLIGSPVIFHQVRPGRQLRAFTIYKFRTLSDGHLSDGRILDDDARQTGIGSFLRRTRLDELPQLWNVLTGEMSLVGPRPLLPRDLPELGDAAHERFTVRPGITGWAQVNGGHQLGVDEKLALDLWYIRKYSPLLDAKILVKTVHMIIFGESRDSYAIEQAFAVQQRDQYAFGVAHNA